MLNRDDAQEGRENASLNRAPRSNTAERPVADREVPLPGNAPMMADAEVAIHQWLDGEATEAVARHADARTVDLWNKINEDSTRMRRMTTPAYVSQQIMAQLPDKAPAMALANSFWTRPISMAPAKAILAAAGLVAIGAIAARLMR